MPDPANPTVADPPAAESTPTDPETPPAAESTAKDEKVTLTKAEYDAQQTQLAAYRRAEKKAKDAAEAAERKRLEDAGEHQKVAEQAKAGEEAAKTELAQFKRTIAISEMARGLGFRDPQDALANLPADLDRDDDNAVKTALDSIVKAKSYLIDSGTPTTRTGGPADGGSPGQTIDEQIQEAVAKGDLKLSMKLKAAKAAANQAKE